MSRNQKLDALPIEKSSRKASRITKSRRFPRQRVSAFCLCNVARVPPKTQKNKHMQIGTGSLRREPRPFLFRTAMIDIFAILAHIIACCPPRDAPVWWDKHALILRPDLQPRHAPLFSDLLPMRWCPNGLAIHPSRTGRCFHCTRGALTGCRAQVPCDVVILPPNFTSAQWFGTFCSRKVLCRVLWAMRHWTSPMFLTYLLGAGSVLFLPEHGLVGPICRPRELYRGLSLVGVHEDVLVHKNGDRPRIITASFSGR